MFLLKQWAKTYLTFNIHNYWTYTFKPYAIEHLIPKKDAHTFSYTELLMSLFPESRKNTGSLLYNNRILFRYFILGLIDKKVYWRFIHDYLYFSKRADDDEFLNLHIRETFLYNLTHIGRFTRYIKIIRYFFNNYILQFKAFIRIFMFNLKWILLAVIIAGLYFFVSLFFIRIEFTKQLAVWYMLMIAYYLLMSTFNSFVSKYRYGKFTTGIQRFWKRTGIIFWILEGFLFAIFFYYFLNSSQEPLYMFDYANLNQEYLFQIRTTYRSMMWLSFIIFLCFILNLNLNSKTYYQNVLLMAFISLCVFYTLYIESYQFVYIMNLLQHRMWVFDDLDQTWSLKNEANNIRTKQQYFILCLVGKYWHFIFIFISWFFFFIKSLEVRKINITLFGYNTQNIIILYWLNLMCLVQWLKVFYKKFFELSYSWFNFQYDEKFFAMFSLEFWYTMTTIFSLNYDVTLVKHLIITSETIFLSNEISLWKYIK